MSPDRRNRTVDSPSENESAVVRREFDLPCQFDAGCVLDQVPGLVRREPGSVGGSRGWLPTVFVSREVFLSVDDVDPSVPVGYGRQTPPAYRLISSRR
jgi:hypothetical protein